MRCGSGTSVVSFLASARSTPRSEAVRAQKPVGSCATRTAGT